MGDINDIVTVDISTETAQVKKEGFGKALILSAGATFTERVREYTELAGAVADGFTSTTPEYAAISAMFAQDPRPPSVLVGRRALAPTMRWILTPVAHDSTTYRVTIDGHALAFTSDSSATLTEIITGIKGVIDGLSLALTTSNQGPNTSLRVLSNTAGDWHRLAVKLADIPNLGVAQDHADPGVGTDLDNILLENDSFYAVMCLTASQAELAAIAAWCDTNKRIMVQATQDSEVITHADSGATDVAHALKGSTELRSALLYHFDNGQFADAAWLGRMLPTDPGQATWDLKELVGVTQDPLTPTHIANLKAKYCNWFTLVGGLNLTQQGKVSGNEWIDVIRGRDWLKARMQERVFGGLSNADKISYTNKGAQVIATEVAAQLQEAVDEEFLAADPKPTVTVPDVLTLSSDQRESRRLPNVRFTGRIAGAIQAVDISGVISP